MAKYRIAPNTDVIVTPLKQEFSTEEDVIINVKCTVDREGGGVWGSWYTDFYVYGVKSDPIYVSSRHLTPHLVDVGGYDRQEDDINLNLGKLSAKTFNGSVVVSSHG